MKRFAIVLIIISCASLFAGITFTQERFVDYVGPDVYPSEVNPLTGLHLENPFAIYHRPMIVKIVNAPDEARPQWGLMQADIIWEYLIAGGDTRFAAIYYANEPELVGPIRSMRLVDFDIAQHYRALVVTSGMADGTWEALRNEPDLLARTISGGGPCPPLCRETSIDRAIEFTLVGSVPKLRDYAGVANQYAEEQALSGMAFALRVPDGGRDVEKVSIHYHNTTIDYHFAADRQVWLRDQNGEPHTDAVTEKQLYFENILIIETEHIVAPYTAEGYWGYTNFAYHAPLIGTGRIIMLRDGRYFEGYWRRDDESEFLQFYDESGAFLPFKPGRTMFNLVPRWDDGYQLSFFFPQQPTATVTFSGGIWLRHGPSINYGPAGNAYEDDQFIITGRNFNGEWIQIQDGDGRVLWLAAENVEVDVNVMSLPLVRSTYESRE